MFLKVLSVGSIIGGYVLKFKHIPLYQPCLCQICLDFLYSFKDLIKAREPELQLSQDKDIGGIGFAYQIF